MAWRGCVFRLAREELLRGNRWSQSFQQRCCFRRAAKKAEQKKGVEEEMSPAHTESSEASAHRRAPPPLPWESHSPQSPPRGFGRLLKPLVFTVGFTGCTFGVAAIWQYEALKSRVQSYFDEVRADWLEKLRPQKQGDFRKEINQWWNSLSEGQRTVTGIIAANVVVFCCWRIPSLQRSMIKYFTANPASSTLCAPMLFSTFSHYSLLHLLANMYVLWSFSSSLVSMLGPEQFLALYMSAGVTSTFVSYVCKTATGRFGPSLGASGAIMAVLAAVCTKMPEAKLAIIFLPMYTFTAGNALKAIVAMDTAGLVLGWRFFDHAAHLGGALSGIWYILFGHELIWKNREALVKVWHELRTRGGGARGGGANGGGSI